MESRPGRNQPCPCGSGKKYKRCCLAADDEARRARAAAQPAPPEAQARLSERELLTAFAEAARVVASRDTAALQARLERLGRLFEPGAALGDIRFDAKGFAEVAQKESLALQRRPPASTDEARSSLFRAAIPRLVSQDLVDRLTGALMEVASARATSPADRAAVCIALAVTEALPPTVKGQAEASPVLEVLFWTQFKEWLALREDLRHRMDHLVADVRQGRLTMSDMLQSLAEDQDRLAAEVAAAPELADLAAKDGERALKRTLKALRGRRPPALLTADEYLWLMAALDPVARSFSPVEAPDEAQKRELLESLVRCVREALDEPLTAGVMQRLVRAANEGGPDARPPAHVADLGMAWSLEPEIVALGVIMSRSPTLVVRAPAEQPLLDRVLVPAPRPEGFRAYASWLDAQGETAAAARVRKLLEGLASKDDAPGAG
ncbi:MAG: SEC-C domain-containing protein [Deltaproteobacteria bacterium]|nr:SEC-C domain-containing protein [Deltaproteobacteria bacterium]